MSNQFVFGVVGHIEWESLQNGKLIKGKTPNTVLSALKNRLAEVIGETTFNGLTAFTTSSANGKDGIAFNTATASSAAKFMLSCSTAGGGDGSSQNWIKFSGSYAATQSETVGSYYLGENWQSAVGVFEFPYASQTGSVALVSADTLSVSWTISVT